MRHNDYMIADRCGRCGAPIVTLNVAGWSADDPFIYREDKEGRQIRIDKRRMGVKRYTKPYYPTCLHGSMEGLEIIKEK